MMKRYLALFLALCLLLSMMSGAVLAAPAASGECGNGCTWSLSSDGVLTISGTGALDYDDRNAIPWLDYAEQIKQVIVEEGITELGSSLFYCCSNLTDITIPETVTEIGGMTFYYCSSLQSVALPDGLQSIGNATFEGCSALTALDIPDSVTYIGDAVFSQCTQLADLTLPANLEYLGDTLSSLPYYQDASNWTGDCLYWGNYLLAANPETASGVCEVRDGTTLIARNAMFGCDGITEIRIPDSVRYIGTAAFLACSNLTDIRLPRNLTTIPNNMLGSCPSLQRVIIPASVTYIDREAFCFCSDLKEIYFTGDAPEIFDNDFMMWLVFPNVTANVYYPRGNATWTEDVMRDYGGDLTWFAWDAVDQDHVSLQFDDIPTTAWYADDVQDVVEMGLMNGVGNRLFAPNKSTNRAMIVTILYRQAGSPEVTAENPFTDVPDGQWYTDAIIWAAEHGIVNGYGDGMFKPTADITREQMAAILHRYYGSPDVEGDALAAFPDVAQVHDYAVPSLNWAVQQGLINGVSTDGVSYLKPLGSATRCQAAAILNRFCNLPTDA